MEVDIPTATNAQPDLPKIENARSICMRFLCSKRDSLSRWKNQTAGGLSQKGFRKKIPNAAEDLCAFCVDLRLHHQFRRGYRKKVLDFKMDRIQSMLSRRDTCILCLMISTIMVRSGDFEPNQDVILRLSQLRKASVIVKGKSGDKKKIGTLQIRHKDECNSLELREPEQSGPHPILMLDSSVPGKVDWPVVKKWIENSPKKDNLGHYHADFRLIDVESLCVVRARKPCEYVCLSYVWGKDTSYQATLDNIHILEQPNSLGTWDDVERRSMIEGSDVPATIKDAIVACSALGKRYLWVDRLCILQDEDEEKNPSKKENINAMGDIYRGAFVTMVALEGTTATHGLYGVSLNRLPLYKAPIGDYVLFEDYDAFYGVLGSTWNKRGWTFQEGFLSPRLLFFTKHELWYEDSDTDRAKSDTQEWAERRRKPIFDLKPGDRLDGSRSRYRSAVWLITQREFCYEWDILDGFSGVLNYFFGNNHRFAIPLENFDHGILWSPHGGPSEKRQSRGTAFPSWCWASVRSHCSHATNSIMPVGSWIFLDGNDVSQTHWPQKEGLTLDDVVLGSILWRNGCMIKPFPDNLHFKGKLREYENLFRKNWSTKDKFLGQCRGMKQDSQGRCRLLDRFDKSQIEVGRKQGVVLGYSQVTVLVLMPRALENGFDLYHGHRQVGRMKFDLRLDDFEAREMLQRGPMEVEVFGLSAEKVWKVNEFDGDDDINFQSGLIEAGLLGFKDTVIPKIQRDGSEMHVMVILTSNGISYRTGLGTVQLLEWLKLERTFKAIVLQ